MRFFLPDWAMDIADGIAIGVIFYMLFMLRKARRAHREFMRDECRK